MCVCVVAVTAIGTRLGYGCTDVVSVSIAKRSISRGVKAPELERTPDDVDHRRSPNRPLEPYRGRHQFVEQVSLHAGGDTPSC
ncbi:hypothetical protein [Halomontanus rarus]|uniref:hypothetical protein n=1 Tax=Halomontanus rarus TaxID=3034020 RepID=UPI001A98F033